MKIMGYVGMKRKFNFDQLINQPPKKPHRIELSSIFLAVSSVKLLRRFCLSIRAGQNLHV